MKYRYDAVIIGGGASGLMCAIAAKRKKPNLKIAIMEKNDRVGKKLLATGNGRCNLTNDNVCADRYVGSTEVAKSVINRIDTHTLLEYFNGLGLMTSKDSEGRWYPLSRQASSVLDVLRFNCENLGIDIFCKQTIRSVSNHNGYLIKTAEDEFFSDKLVIASGSKAAPKLGGSASAVDYLKNFGHRTAPFSPDLCPITVRSDVLRSLKGLRANAEVCLRQPGKPEKRERGEVQFNEDNLSGICVFNLSLYTDSYSEISLDLLPDISNKELFNILIENKERFGKQCADNIFTGIMQKRLAQAVLKTSGVRDFSRKCGTLEYSELKTAATTAKNMRFEIVENAGFDRAQACRGGVTVKGQLDTTTLESKLMKNLFICGEALDVCGECGGYNLHFAFATGIIAGENL